MKIEPNNIYLGDCLEVMKHIPDKSIDMILCDLPYGTTACKWDTIIPFEPLWEQYKRIIKDNGAIVLTASQPFTSALVMSNLGMFKYSWIYKKRCASNFAQAKYAPMKEHEDVLVFANGKVNYYPIKEERQGSGKERARYAYSDKSRHASGDFVGNIKGEYDKENDSGNDEMRYPSSVQEFNNRASGDRGFHPTQKPVALCEYLIKTYTNEGETVLDNCMGSGSTIVACINTNRNYIGIEKELKYFEIAKKRIESVTAGLYFAMDLAEQYGKEEINENRHI
jgi:site-specific DNA-methyltransferase (adenine-specific)